MADVRERLPVSWDRLVLKEEQAAEFLKCSPQTLRKRAASGEIPRYVVGGEYRYYVYDLLDYVISPDADRGSDRSGSDPG
ncbi:MAG TPA: helix-turn-helix domain-containing protein [Rubrobacter sp.]